MASKKSQDVAIVIVTFNRQELLTQLLKSIDEMIQKPASVVVINNASTDGTKNILDLWQNQEHQFETIRLDLNSNTGGAGGFKEGIQQALTTKATWVWVMDDDVSILPDALIRAEKWMGSFDAFMGQRLTPEGEIVNWAHRLNDKTGLAPLLSNNPFDEYEFLVSNSGCFEGMFISTDAVRDVGLPDSRFFITWDDAVYGWLLSRNHRVGYVQDIFLQRTIEMKSVGTKSFTVYARNDLGRYYFIRNRAIQAKYFESKGSLHSFWFAVGTLRVIIIEIARAIIVERKVKSLKVIFKAINDQHKLRKDSSFTVPES